MYIASLLMATIYICLLLYNIRLLNEYRSISCIVIKWTKLFFPSLRGKNVHELASEQSWVHFITMLRYEFNNFIITPSTGLEGYQNYNLIKINTKHANYKNRVAEKIILSAQCHRAFNTCASKNFRLAQGSLAIRFWIERKPYVKRYFNANYVILSIENNAIQFKTLSLNSLLK